MVKTSEQVGNAVEKDLYRQGFFSAYLEVTDRCNLGCEHCFRGDKADVPEELMREPSLDKLRDMRDNLESAKLKGLFYELSGGEFLMREDWRKVFRLFLETGKPTYIFTNATLADDCVAQDIGRLNEEYPGQIIVNSSLDSHIKEVNDRTRAKFCETLEGLSRLGKSGVKLKVNITLNGYNLPYIDDTVEFIARNFTSRIVLNSLRPVFPITEENSKLFVQYEKAVEVARRVTKLAGDRGWEIYSTFQEDGNSYCDAGRNHSLITSSGDVTPCYSLRQPQFVFGNLHREPFSLILERIADFSKGRDRRVLLCEHLENIFGTPPHRMERHD